MKHLFAMLLAGATLAMGMTSCNKAKASADDEDVIVRDSTFTEVAHPDWTRNAVIYEVNWRQFSDSGKIAGVEKELPRLKDLGVDILWMMPIHPISEVNRKGGLGSYYAVKDYKAVNPELGTTEEMKAFIKKAHEMGFKVILDWVPNHSGCDNAWVTEHPDWYERNEKGEMYGPFDWTDVYAFDYSNPEMRKGMIDAMQYWLKDMGVDGFRCDVAMEVPTDFWNEARKELEEVNPEVFMLAEASEPELEEKCFDMAYNWPMKDLFSAIAATSGQYTFVGSNDKEPRKFPATTAVAIDSLLAAQAKDFPTDAYLMNMITNHDLNSWEGTEFERLGNLQGAFAVLSYTLPGMPLIYTGQETGMNRAFEFFVKDVPPTWEPRNEYFTFYKTLNNLKHSEPALRAGVLGGKMDRYPTTDPDLYIFSRTAKGRTVTVFTNLGSEEAKIEYTGAKPANTEGLDIFTGKTSAYPTSLAPGQYAVYTNN